MYAALPDRPRIIDLSGGSPDLVPEWPIWMLRALRRHGLDDVYLWSDDNLSTDYLFSGLVAHEVELLADSHRYGRVCCFKGFDEASFVFNTGARASDFDRQFQIAKRTMALGVDLYGYVTLTSPPNPSVRDAIRSFMDRLQQLDAKFPLRVVPLEIQEFSPVTSRMNAVRSGSLVVQAAAVLSWQEELAERFSYEERSSFWTIGHHCGVRPA